MEQISVHTNKKTKVPFGASITHRSVTTSTVMTYPVNHPAFTVMEWDKEFMVPINVEVYMMDLDKANKNPDKKPEWTLNHSFINTYQMEDLSPSSFKKFTEKLYSDGKMAGIYESHR